jgi:hypothetical protein
MREFTKSLSTFSWAMTLFSVQQLGNLFKRNGGGQGGKAAQAFDAVTCSAEAQLGQMLGETFRTGDKLQRSMVDMMFGMFGQSMNRMPGSGAGSGCSQCSGGGASGGGMPGGGMPGGGMPGGGMPATDGTSTGWGPMPPSSQ